MSEKAPDSVHTLGSSAAGSSPKAKWPAWAFPTITGAAGLVIGLLIGGVGLGMVQSAEAEAKEAEVAADEATASKAVKALLMNAVYDCDVDYMYAVLSDEGMTLTVDSKGKKDYGGGLSVDELSCILTALDAPSSVVSHMGQTTALDGRQTESWGNIEVSWSYHPNRGTDGVFKIIE